MSTSGLPIVNPAFEPASVRSGSPATQKAYASALNFESMLVQQLSQSLTESGGLGGGEGGAESAGEGGSGDPVSTQLSSLLPQTLTSSVMSHGGLGLAQQLMGSLLPAGEAPKEGAAAGRVGVVAGGVGAVAGREGAAAGAPAASAGAFTVGGGSFANAPAGRGGATTQIDPTGGVQA